MCMRASQGISGLSLSRAPVTQHANAVHAASQAMPRQRSEITKSRSRKRSSASLSPTGTRGSGASPATGAPCRAASARSAAWRSADIAFQGQAGFCPACMWRPCSQQCTVIEDRLVPEQGQPFLFLQTICLQLGQAGSYQRNAAAETPAQPAHHIYCPCNRLEAVHSEG